MTDVVRFTNGFIAMPDGTVSIPKRCHPNSVYDADILIQAIKSDLYISPSSGTIVSGQSSFFDSHRPPIRTIDLGGNILSPGLIDVQLNGAYGVDFSELNNEDADGGEERYIKGLEKVAERILETGCTSFVATIITQKEEMYRKVSVLPGLCCVIDRTSAAAFAQTSLADKCCSCPGLPRRGTVPAPSAAGCSLPNSAHDCCTVPKSPWIKFYGGHGGCVRQGGLRSGRSQDYNCCARRRRCDGVYTRTGETRRDSIHWP